MKIQYCSDLHIEFWENAAYLSQHPIVPLGDVLVMAGDILPLGDLDKHQWFFDAICDRFEMIYWVPGNHEYYRYDIENASGYLDRYLRDNLRLVDNRSVIYRDVKFIFSTLWSKIGDRNAWFIERGMADFNWIRLGERKFTVNDFNSLHEKALAFVKQEINPADAYPTIVVSHHVPTLFNYPEKYKDSLLTEAFASELFETIEDSGVDYWIYGHHHNNRPNFKIGNTKLVTNQLGYVKYGEHTTFNAYGNMIEI